MRLLPSEPECVKIAEPNESRSIVQQRCSFSAARNPCVGDKVPQRPLDVAKSRLFGVPVVPA